jgi:nucleoside-diphosphate-sugar epimerase
MVTIFLPLLLSARVRGISRLNRHWASLLCLVVIASPWVNATADTHRNRLVIIGATANSAGELIEQALATGREVIGVTRKPETLKIQHDRFTTVYGDVRDVETIEALLTGDEVVVSYIDVAFPFGAEIPAGVDLFSRGTTNIIAAMKKKGNRRLIVASNMAGEYIVLDKPADDAPLIDRLAWARRHKYADARLMETIVEGSELDYIILRLPHLLSAKSQGRPNVVVNKNSFNIAVKNQTPSRNLTLADLSTFILEQMNSDVYLGTTVGLYN